MARLTLSATLALALAAMAAAQTPGFQQSDLGKARSEASSTGKLIFIYFNLPG